MNPLRHFCVLALLATAGCASLSEEDQTRLENFKFNSKLYLQNGDFARAEDQCRKGLALDDEDKSLNLLLGTALCKQQNPSKTREAEVHLQNVLDDELYTEEYKALLELGSAEFWLGEYFQEREKPEKTAEYFTRAGNHLERALELHPELIEASLFLGKIEGRLAHYDSAAAHLAHGIEQLEKQCAFLDKRLKTVTNYVTRQVPGSRSASQPEPHPRIP